MKYQKFVCLALISFSAFFSEVAARDVAIVDEVSYPVYKYGFEVKPTSTVNPVYPVEARNEKRGGRVLVGALVNEKGKVTATFVSKSDAGPDIEQAARAAVARWRFPKQKEDDQLIKYVVFVPISMLPE